MASLHVNNYSSTLNGAITGADTTIIVNDATGLPSPTGGDYFTLTLDDQAGTVEIVHVTARSGTSLTVTRGQGGTSPLSWPDLTTIEQRLTAATIDSKITQVFEDTSPELSADLDCSGEELINCLRVRTQIICKDTDTTNNIEFTTSRQTFKPFNVDVMNLTSAGMQLGGANTRVTTILDEDTMASDSNTALATQQSIKAYVDTEVAGLEQNLVKAWLSINTVGTLTVLDSYNISSVIDDGTGLFTVNFSTAFANANYAMGAVTRQPASNQATAINIRAGTLPTTSSTSLAVKRDNGADIDVERATIMFIGDQ